MDEAVAAFRAGDTDRAELLAAVALSSARTDADAARVVDALCMQARVALRRGDISTVSSLGEEAGETARRTGQRELETMPLHMRAVAARMRRDYPTARRLYEESIRLNESLGDEVMVTAEFRNLAYVELHTGNSDRARELFAGAAVHADESGYEFLRPYLALDAAVLAAEDGNMTKAASLAGAAHLAFVAAGQVPDPDGAAEEDWLLARLKAAMGKDGFERWMRKR